MRRVLVLCGLVTLGVWGCGDSSAASGNGGSAGVIQAGSAMAGATLGGNANAGRSGGVSGSDAAGGSGGERDLGIGGIYEVCLICGGANFGVAGHPGGGGAGRANGGAAGSSGGATCDDATCAPNQYCRAACTGIGGAMGKATCADLPAACQGVPTCSCICGVTSSFCTPGAPQVQCGCG